MWLQRVAEGIFQIPSYLRISPQCKDLLSRILEVDPDVRCSLAQIKAHSWFQTNLPQDLRVRSPCLPTSTLVAGRPCLQNIIWGASTQ